MRIATVVGNRPQFIKAAAVSGPLRERHQEVMIHTGQHHDPELSQVFFDELQIPAPDRRLELGGGSNLGQAARMIAALEAELQALRPDAVLVYGDTNSTLAAAVCAAHLQLPLIHVEAGMRSFDPEMPEETNRVVADHLSRLCLCSTPLAVENLRREGLGERSVLVGDVMADIALRGAELARRRSQVLERERLEPGGYLLVTAHRAGNVDDRARLAALVALLEALPIPAVYPLHPRTRRRLSESDLLRRLERAPQLRLLEPLGYLDLLSLARHARAVLTDSGGLQKEAYLLGTPCLTLRERTEWQETVDLGWNTLVDLDLELTLAALAREPPSEHPDLYQAGRAASNVVAAIDSWSAGAGG